MDIALHCIIIHYTTNNNFFNRFSPGKDWEVNKGLDKALGLLESIKDMYDEVSVADLIILSSTMAMDKATGHTLKMIEDFCPGRVDDDNGEAWGLLKPRVVGNKEESVELIKDYIEVLEWNTKIDL